MIRLKHIAIVAALLAPGFSRAATPLDVWCEEIVFQAAHVADLQQSLDIKHHPNISEDSSSLDAGWAIGPYPSDRRIYAYMGTEATLHMAVTAALVHWAPAWSVRVWELATISFEGGTVARNARLGLQVRF